MKRFLTRLLIAFAIFLAVFFLSSCASPETPVSAVGNQDQATATPSDTPPPEPSPEPIAARVNDQTIPLAALDREVERRLAGMRSVGAPEPADMYTFRLAVLNTLIDQLLIEQAAAIQGISVTEAEVNAEVEVTISIAGSRENWEAQLKADNLTEAEYRAGLYAALLTQKMRDLVTANTCVSVEQVHARHILVADEESAARLKTMLDTNADFGTLAAQHSLDVTTRLLGGDLGWFARGQLLQPVVEEVAFGLAVNAIGGPVRSELGYHIIQTLERAQDRPIDPETCYRLTENAFERWIQDLAHRAQIEKYPDGQ